MFNADDLHPETGKYKHIIIPSNVKSVKVKFKDGGKKETTVEPRGGKAPKLRFPSYRNTNAIGQ